MINVRNVLLLYTDEDIEQLEIVRQGNAALRLSVHRSIIADNRRPNDQFVCFSSSKLT